jgi:hypothetical protein
MSVTIETGVSHKSLSVTFKVLRKQTTRGLGDNKHYLVERTFVRANGDLETTELIMHEAHMICAVFVSPKCHLARSLRGKYETQWRDQKVQFFVFLENWQWVVHAESLHGSFTRGGRSLTSLISEMVESLCGVEGWSTVEAYQSAMRVLIIKCQEEVGINLC